MNGDTIAECRDCDSVWVGEGSWDAAFEHMYSTHHRLTILESL
jgi:hypothetical protein